jgi:hypothetical protein
MELNNMKRNYLLVYHNKYTDMIYHKYFESEEEMKKFIKEDLGARKFWKVLHKYEIKEIK